MNNLQKINDLKADYADEKITRKELETEIDSMPKEDIIKYIIEEV